jgi:linoleoyl-CoA desaturase
MSVLYRYKIHDKLYDLNEFIHVHPGGTDIFNNLKPYTNITPMIYSYHKNPKQILAMLSKYEIPLNGLVKIEYDKSYTYNTYCELKQLVYDEIQEKKLPLYWSKPEVIYNSIAVFLYLGTWMFSFINAKSLSCWWMAILAILNIGIGTIIIHETAHYSAFKNQTYNNFISNNYPLADLNQWKFNHNYLHHSFTNTHDDFDFVPGKLLLYSNQAAVKWFHQNQYLFYPLLLLVATFTRHAHFTVMNTNKLFLLFMIYMFRFTKTYVFFAVLSGLFTLIANVSHIQHECIDKNTEQKNDFLYNQVSSAINYKTDTIFERFICFGLDIQIEHHLFPNLPTSTLRQIAHIVRKYCKERNIPYIEKPSIYAAINSYLHYLYSVGNPVITYNSHK